MININADGAVGHPHPITTANAATSLVGVSSHSISSSSSSSTPIDTPSVGVAAGDAPVFVASAGASDELFSSKINYIVNRVSCIVYYTFFPTISLFTK